MSRKFRRLIFWSTEPATQNDTLVTEVEKTKTDIFNFTPNFIHVDDLFSGFNFFDLFCEGRKSHSKLDRTIEISAFSQVQILVVKNGFFDEVRELRTHLVEL